MENLININKSVKEYVDSVDEELTNICDPLFKNFGICVFCYTRTYKNGKHLFLDTNKEWRNDFFDKGLYLDLGHHERLFGEIPEDGTKKFIWNYEPESKLYKIMREKHNMWNGLTVCRKKKEYIEAWHFSTKRENTNVIGTYISQENDFNEFVNYFKNQAKEIIEESLNSYLLQMPIISELTRNDYIEVSNSVFNTSNKIFIESEKGFVRLGRREYEVFKNLAKGMSIKEISNIMGISKRTVESHMLVLKSKFQVGFKSDLIKIYHQI